MLTQEPHCTVLQEINGMADWIRALRRADAVGNTTQIKAVEGQLRTKWDELRTLRAGSVSPSNVPPEGFRLHHALASVLRKVTDDDGNRRTHPV